MRALGATIRVLICDDPGVVRTTLASVRGIDVVGEAADGREALRRLRAAASHDVNGVDVMLMDIAIPYRDGLDVLRQLRSEFPRLPLLMLSARPDKQYAVRSMKLGAAGYLDKSADAEQMEAAVRRAARGGLFVTPSDVGRGMPALQQGWLPV